MRTMNDIHASELYRARENVYHSIICHHTIVVRHYTFLLGTSGLTSNTAFTRSSTTFGPVFCPIALISSSCFCVSLSACSSAALLPEVCYITHKRSRQYLIPEGSRWESWCAGRGRHAYLFLKSLILLLLLLAVLLDFLLGFAAGVFYSFRAVCPAPSVHGSSS